MIKQDVLGLSEHQRRALSDAFNEGVDPHRTRGIILSAAVGVVAVILFFAFGADTIFFAGLTLVTLVVSVFEKFTYRRKMATYEFLLRRFVNRAEQLEGVPLTAPVPAESAHEVVAS